jgi:hypothetical protein
MMSRSRLRPKIDRGLALAGCRGEKGVSGRLLGSRMAGVVMGQRAISWALRDEDDRWHVNLACSGQKRQKIGLK